MVSTGKDDLVTHSDADAVAIVLRAFADASTPFRSLMHELLHAQVSQMSYGIHPSHAPGATSYTVLAVSGTRSDGRVVTWAVSLTAGESLSVEASVEVDDDSGGTEEVFSRVATSEYAADAAAFIVGLATEVCAQRQYWFVPEG